MAADWSAVMTGLLLFLLQVEAWTPLGSPVCDGRRRHIVAAMEAKSADDAVRRAWLTSIESDGRTSDLSARLNARSRYFDPELRRVYDHLSNAERGRLVAVSKEVQRKPQTRDGPVVSEHAAVSPAAGTYAVLVDAENINWRTMAAIMAKISIELGDARVRRMYGDFSEPSLAKWAEVERNHSFMMVHQSALVKGKGCSDVLMAADAMELRYENQLIDGYCIVSSDSDFTPLVKRLREAGKHVVGFGAAKAPLAFQQSCHAFFTTDGLALTTPAVASGHVASRHVASAAGGFVGAARPAAPGATCRHGGPAEHVGPELERELFDVVNAAAVESDGGWARLATVERLLLAQRQDFDVREWGVAHLAELVGSARCSVLRGLEATPEFEVCRRRAETMVRIRPLHARHGLHGQTVASPAQAEASTTLTTTRRRQGALSAEQISAEEIGRRSEEIKGARAAARAELLARHAAASAASSDSGASLHVEALRSFFTSYECLKRAYASGAGGGDGGGATSIVTDSAWDSHRSAADAKVREAVGLLQPSMAGRRITSAGALSGSARRSPLLLGRELFGWWWRGITIVVARLCRSLAPRLQLGRVGGGARVVPVASSVRG